ncbi:BON domain-containing protein [Nesterenkonia sp. CF4.4]|uniref:BON domain-containing protein n=1 Tax=Nesterenkonia sp. CF4.4 TaxID=3373079 RepID=UPI003EE6F1CC
MQTPSPTTPSTDHTITAAVRAELEWTPDLDASNISVHVEDSTVTLTGIVGTYSELLALDRITRRVRGVTSAVNNVTVDPVGSRWVTDSDIRRVVERALTWATTVPRTVKSRVLNRHVTLTGEVDWDFQRAAAQRAVEDLRGVKSLENQITLTARTPVENAEERLKNAMSRNPQIDARGVTVTIVDHTATLTGHVSSLAEKKQAGLATWACPDVTQIENRLDVRAEHLGTTPDGLTR